MTRFAVVGFALGALCCRQPPAPTAVMTGNGPPTRLLVVTYTTGFRHDSIATMAMIRRQSTADVRALADRVRDIIRPPVEAEAATGT